MAKYVEENMNREQGYNAIWNGRRGILSYFYVMINSWCFVESGTNKVEEVTKEQILDMSNITKYV